MAFWVVDVDHQLEAVSDVDVVRIDILSALLQGFGKLQSSLEDVLLILHDGVVGVLVVVGES